MAQQYSIQNIAQLAQSAGNIPFIYDNDTDNYRPMEQGDFSFFNSSNSASQDAFGRLRVSEPFTLFDSSHRYSDNGVWVSSSGVSGNAVFNSNQGLVDLNVTNASGSYVKRETTKVFAYQPGKSLLFLGSGIIGHTGITSTSYSNRLGYFDDENGLTGFVYEWVNNTPSEDLATYDI